MRNPPTAADRTNALTPRAPPICRTNCWLVVALPRRATGTLFLHDHGERRREEPHAGVGNQRDGDDPGESVFECDHEKEEPENLNNDPDHNAPATCARSLRASYFRVASQCLFEK